MHVLPWVTSGGVERRRLQLAEQLDNEMFVQRIVCLYSKFDLADRIRASGVEVICLNGGTGSLFDVRTVMKVMREIRRFRPDIVHGAVFEGVTMAVLAGSLARVPHIVVEETGDPSIRSWRGDLVMGALARFADIAVGVSPPITEYLRRGLRLGGRARLILNGVASPRDVDEQELNRLRSSLSITHDDLVVGSAGRIDDRHKRFTDLIRAVSHLNRAKLLIVGAGADLDMLKDFAEGMGIGDRVVFVGYQADIAPYYRLMDVFALASVQESFGLVIAEAMWCGLPVVATRVGGIPYLVEEGRSGVLVPPRAPERLGAALRELRDDPDLRSRMGTRGQAIANEKFTGERYVKDVARLYCDLVHDREYDDIST